MAAPNNTQTAKLALSWATKFSISIFSALNDVACRRDGTVNRRFLKLLDPKAKSNPIPVNGVSSKDVTVDAANNIWFRLFTPAADVSGTGTLPVIIFFHGGGFAFLAPDSYAYDAVCKRFCRRLNAVVVSVNYRLTPEHRYPAQYDDGFAVAKFLDENPAALPENANIANCFLAGDSAGANLAHHVAVRVAQSDLRRLHVVGLITIQPFFGGKERTEAEIRLPEAPIVSVPRTDWMWKVFLPEGSDRDHGSVNVSGPNAMDLSGLKFPDTLVFVGGFDPLQDWQRKYYEWLRKSRKEAEIIEYPNMCHAFYLMPNLPEASQLISQVKDFITKRVSL